MVDRPAAEFGSYVDAKFMRGLKVMRVMVDIPIERSNEFLKVFGAPNGADPVPVVLARLDPNATIGETSGISRAPSGAQENGPAHGGEQAGATSAPIVATPSAPVQGQGKPKHSYTRSQIAALKCRDIEFQRWVTSKHPAAFRSASHAMGLKQGDTLDKAECEELAARVVRILCNVESRGDIGDNEAGQAWDKLETSFRFRSIVHE